MTDKMNRKESVGPACDGLAVPTNRGTPRRAASATHGLPNTSTPRRAPLASPEGAMQYGLLWGWNSPKDLSPNNHAPLKYNGCTASRCLESDYYTASMNAERKLRKSSQKLRMLRRELLEVKRSNLNLLNVISRANDVLQVGLENDISYEQLLERITMCVNALQ